MESPNGAERERSMKVKILASGKIEDLEHGYAVRLVEQGRAVPAEEKKEKTGGKASGGK